MAKATEQELATVAAQVLKLDRAVKLAQELVFAVFQAQQVPGLKMAEARSMAVVLGSVKAMASELLVARERVLAPVREQERASAQLTVHRAIEEQKRVLARVGQARGESGGAVPGASVR